MLTIVTTVILGVVEGITEFLPISSTAHLILTSHLLGITQSEFLKSFEIAIQSGAILAVVFLYWKTLIKPEVIKRLMVAFIPTGVIGLTLYKLVKHYLLGNTAVVLWSLLIGGALLILFEKRKSAAQNTTDESNVEALSYMQCALVGLFQSIALVPGVSRSAATIIGGSAIGISRKTIVEFSFLLAVPTMAAATALDLLKTGSTFTPHEYLLLGIGFIVSLLVAAASIKWLLNYIRKHDFTSFGIYRIILAAAFFLVRGL